MAEDPQKQNARMYVAYGLIAGMLAGVILGTLIDNISIGIGVGVSLGALVSSIYVARLDRTKGSDSE